MKGHLYQRGAVALAVVLVAVLGLTAALPAGAEDRARRPVTVDAVDLAAVQVFAGGIDLAPKVRYERAILTVSGMGRTFTQQFDSFTRPSITPFAPDGDMLADGVYRWELQLVPDERTAKGLRASAANNGGVALRPWLPKSGSFAIRGGILATPEATEEGASQRRRERAANAGRRADRPDRELGGQVWGAEKASRGDAVDTDAMAGSGLAAGLKADGAASRRVRGERQGARSSQTGPDSDHQAAQMGASAERVLVTVPKAHELNQDNPSPRSDGSNGRPRSDR